MAGLMALGCCWGAVGQGHEAMGQSGVICSNSGFSVWEPWAAHEERMNRFQGYAPA